MKKPPDKKPDPVKVGDALNTLIEQFGDDVDHYVNFKRLMDGRSLLQEVRPMMEEIISESVLPGFKFEDDYHAAWFLKKWGWQVWVTNYPMKPEFYVNNWFRMIAVPNKHHYVAEVAVALQAFDKKTKTTIRDFQKIVESGDKKEINIAAQKIQLMRALRGLPPGGIKGERDLMAMKSWPSRLKNKFPKTDLPKKDQSFFRLATNATKYRKDREKATPPSGWRIVQVTNIGNIYNPNAEDPKNWKEWTEGYFEKWEWHPIEGVVTPKMTSFTFWEPADLKLWERKWKKNRPVFKQ